jgi:hypothetical protein
MKFNRTLLKGIYSKIAILFLAGTFLGCQKDGVDNSEIIGKLSGRWTFVNYVTNEFYSNSDHLNTLAADPGDFIEFTPNEKVYLRLFSSTDTSRYTIAPTNRIVVDYNDTFDIKSITETQLILYNKRVTSAVSYYEQTYNLQK